jgi:putative FmdB family regulatory protein
MPIYEFQCSACGEDFEKLVLPGRSDGVSCPACGSEAVVKQFSTFGVKLGEAPSPFSGPKGGPCGCTPSSCGCH